VREHNEAVNRLDFMPRRKEITADYDPGGESPRSSSTTARRCSLRKLDPTPYDATDRIAAMNYIQAHQAQGEIVTGLLYVDPESGRICTST
jgi:2-oxoglutarate ferredoxin oxidoreductase subunit beta